MGELIQISGAKLGLSDEQAGPKRTSTLRLVLQPWPTPGQPDGAAEAAQGSASTMPLHLRLCWRFGQQNLRFSRSIWASCAT